MRVCFLEWCKRTRTTSMFQLVLHFCHPHVLRDDWPPADITCLEEKNSSRIRSKLLRRKRLTWIGALKFSSSAERQSSGQGACNLMKRRMFLDLSNTSCNDGMNKNACLSVHKAYLFNLKSPVVQPSHEFLPPQTEPLPFFETPVK